MEIRLRWLLGVALVAVTGLRPSPAADAPRACIVQADSLSADRALADLLGEIVQRAGYQSRPLSTDTLCDPRAFGQSDCGLLVIANGRMLPLSSIAVIQQYLAGGGHMLVCGLPLWEDGVARAGGKWMTRAERAAALARTKPSHPLFDFAKEDLARWRRSSDAPRPATTYEIVSETNGKSLHAIVPALSGWDNIGRDVVLPFPDGDSLTCFRAKGDRTTRHLMLEWQEKDGSRWIATVELSEHWQSYALPPEAFKSWEPRNGRGGAGDHLNVTNAQRLIVGVAYSHMNIQNRRQEYWLADVGTASNPIPNAPPDLESPHLESLSPSYQFFPINTPARVRETATGPEGASASFEVTSPLTGIHPRPGPAGFDKVRPWLREVLAEAVSPQGEHRGAVATLTVLLAGEKPAGAWAAFTPADAAFYREPFMHSALEKAARALRRGLFLNEGGVNRYTTLEGQPLRCGARVANIGADDAIGRAECQVRLTVTAAGSAEHAFQRTWPVAVPRHATATVEAEWTPPPAWPAQGYRVVTELVDGGQVLQRVSHELHVWKPRADPKFIETRDGAFWLEGRPWKVHGVNYMPSSGVGLANHNLFEFWLGAAAYDPEIVRRDLERVRAMQMNALSVFLDHRSLAVQNLLDLFRLCDELGLHVNLSLRPGTPLDFHWSQVREMIAQLRLAENDTLFAYDLAWEPSHYDEAYQKRYSLAWRQWIERRYGDMQRAEQAWGVPPSRADGQVSIPPAHQLATDGPWRRMVADYRSFLDEYLAGPYAEARGLVRSVDLHHAVSFRMQLAGDPTHATNPLPYDFFGLRDAVDIWEPEAYGRIGDWERVKPGQFTAAYARLCDPRKPVLWAEMGMHVWDQKTMAVSQDRMDFQAAFYADFYRMLIASGADGVFAWWYPGGYRVNEQSDYGIINPDGTDRPVTRVIREWGARFLSAPKPPPVDLRISVDRDADARGLVGLYQAVEGQYWRGVAEGHRPALRWAHPPGQ